MSGFGRAYAEEILRFTLYGDAISSLSGVTTLWHRLHKASPANGDQTTQEATYPSYAAVSTPRNSGSSAWSISGNVASLPSAIAFPTSTGSPSESLTHWSIGTQQTAAGVVLFHGTATPPYAVTAADLIPTLTTSSTITAAGIGNAYAQELLRFTLYGDAISSLSGVSTLWLRLHTATPIAGTQTTSEATFGGYAALAVPRSSGSSSFGVTLNRAQILSRRSFAASTGSPSETLTHWSLGTQQTGSGVVLFAGPIFPAFNMNAAGKVVELTKTTVIDLL